MNLKATIKKRGLKITWIADKLKVSQPLLSMYLNGNRTMPVEIEKKLQKLLK